MKGCVKKKIIIASRTFSELSSEISELSSENVPRIQKHPDFSGCFLVGEIIFSIISEPPI
ncbi:MAG: hypothetical protein U9N04_02865 [Patescibacteria group bacterium]|nr:hypothetical protein [Patescibacteria group bacterium]